MPLAVTLCLDAASAARVEAMWRALAEAGADDALRLGYRPHLTLAVLPEEGAVEAAGDAMRQAARAWGALPVVLASLGIFPGPAPVLFAAPVPSPALLDRHRALCGLLPAGIDPHYRPGAWVPHVTLARDVAGRLLDIARAAWDGPVAGRLDRVELVRFPPVAVLESLELA
jgi:2'-5' RNA ligase